MQKLLLLHGALGYQQDFDVLKEVLSQYYECYSFDFNGHGSKSADTAAFSIKSFAEQTKSFVETHQLQNAFVFGYSMGGYVATYLHKRTGYFLKIYTLGTKFIWQIERAQKEASKLNPAAIIEKAPDYAQTLIQKHSAAHWEGVLRKTAAMMLDLGQNPALSMLDFNNNQCTVAVALGDKDKMIPFEDAVAIKNALPRACLDVLPFTQHPLDRVNTELLVQRLKYFFDL